MKPINIINIDRPQLNTQTINQLVIDSVYSVTTLLCNHSN